jgi:hypothetical protein
MSLDYTKELKRLAEALESIDVNLQVLANTKAHNITTAFVSRKVIAARLGVPPIVIDKLIHTGTTSQGKAGLVEGIHYAKLDPTETNASRFLFDSTKVLQAAWQNFTGYGND